MIRLPREHRMLVELREPDADHDKDADCSLDDLDVCTGCGVWHGDPCPDCGGRGYHAEDCS